jgi:cobalt-precorrin 5A hydrolase
MIVAGIGMRAGASAQEIVDLVRRAMAEAAVVRLDSLATLDARAPEPGFAEAAAHLGLPGIAVPPLALRAMAGSVRTRSARVETLHGVGSVAEASALAAAGDNARLLLPRIASATVTCALAEGGLP